MSEIEYRLVEEAELSPGERRAIGTFIADLFGAKGEPYREEGWRLLRPTLRVLAYRSGVLVGHYAAFAPRSDPAYALVGLGDCVVAVSERRRGIAVTMARHLIPACEERGAQALISSTEIPAGLIANDFHPVTDFSYYWEQDGACHRHPNWWSKELRGAPRRPVRLIDNDF